MLYLYSLGIILYTMNDTAKNIIFGLSGGWLIGTYFTFMAIVHAFTIIGMKKAYGLIKCAAFCFAPFGKNARISFASHKLGNTLWAVTLGWQAALICLLFAAFWFMTFFGAYLGERYFSLAQYAIAPFGAKLEEKENLLIGEAPFAPF